MIMKKIFLFLFSLFITTMAFAYDAEIDGIYYYFDDENNILQSYCYVCNKELFLNRPTTKRKSI